MTTLLVAEKPKVAKRLADALGDHEVETNRGVKNFVLEKQGEAVIVAPAVGHLFTLEQKEGDWEYPVFDVEWVPGFESDDGADYMRKYYNNLRDQVKKADAYINGCDFDVEGSVIGYNVIKRLADPPEERVRRMKFSTLTTSDLRDAFGNLQELDKGQTEAGLTRHILDWYYGINISRALMLAVKAQDRFQSLSTGRVQGPALKILADREREIQAFEPEPYWEIVARLAGMEAQHADNRMWEEDKATVVLAQCQGEDARVVGVDRNRYKHSPPVPFNLTGLQREAQSQFSIAPKRTQQIAQSLYEESLISYPRTSSQKLPAAIGYTGILSKLQEQDDYAELAEQVMEKEDASPRQGKKTDEAHPAIYPTGVKPKGLNSREENLYDLIVKRFFAVFGEAAIRETVTVTLDIADHTFTATGKRTVQRNWFDLYEPYVRVKTIDLPDVEEGQVLPVEEVEKLDKETQPPNRYSQSGIVSELEERGLGTKATRANIIDTLYKRNYIDGGSITVTDLGLAVVDALEEYTSEILSEALTRDFEQSMEKIRAEEATSGEVLEEARDFLSDILETFREHQDELGKHLVDAIDLTREKERQLGPCQECEDGTLRIIKTKNGRFAGCSNYPECDNSWPLPGYGKIESEDEACDECGTPRIKVIRKGKRPFTMCLDPDCPTKDDWD